MKTPGLFAISGVKNSGKTTYCEKVIPALTALGLQVAVIKHDGHEFEADVPGTDSSRCFAAGAVGTVVFSDTKFCAVRRWSAPDLDVLTALFPQADVILLEGFKHWSGPKIELVRRGNSAAGCGRPDRVPGRCPGGGGGSHGGPVRARLRPGR